MNGLEASGGHKSRGRLTMTIETPPDTAERARVPDAKRIAESGVSPTLVIGGVAVGLILILLGLWFLWENKVSLLSSLLTCVGFGLVLASFGSKAGGSWAGWTTTGAGAMTIVLSFVPTALHAGDIVSKFQTGAAKWRSL